MKDPKQDEINEREWRNENNWKTFLGIYYSKSDSRNVVPKKNPKYGTTINFGHKDSKIYIFLLLLLMSIPIIILVVIFLLAA